MLVKSLTCPRLRSEILTAETSLAWEIRCRYCNLRTQFRSTEGRGQGPRSSRSSDPSRPRKGSRAQLLPDCTSLATAKAFGSRKAVPCLSPSFGLFHLPSCTISLSRPHLVDPTTPLKPHLRSEAHCPPLSPLPSPLSPQFLGRRIPSRCSDRTGQANGGWPSGPHAPKTACSGPAARQSSGPRSCVFDTAQPPAPAVSSLRVRKRIRLQWRGRNLGESIPWHRKPADAKTTAKCFVVCPRVYPPIFFRSFPVFPTNGSSKETPVLTGDAIFSLVGKSSKVIHRLHFSSTCLLSIKYSTNSWPCLSLCKVSRRSNRTLGSPPEALAYRPSPPPQTSLGRVLYSRLI